MNVSGGARHHILRVQIFKERGRLQGTLEIVADRDYAHVIAADGERFHKIHAGAVADQTICYIRENRIDAVFADVDSHDLVPHLIKLAGTMSAESS